MAILYIECGSTIRSPFNTGIQRVVRNIIKNKDAIEVLEDIDHCFLVEYRNSNFYIVDIENLNQSLINKSQGLFYAIFKKIGLYTKFIVPQSIYTPLVMFFLKMSKKLANFLLRLKVKKSIKKIEKNLNNYQQQFSDQKHVLLLLDASWASDMWSEIKQFRFLGGKVCAVQYDLIPFLYPETVEDYTRKIYTQWWKEAIHNVDAVMCISDSVRQEFYIWQSAIKSKSVQKEFVDFFYLGSDLLNTDPVVQLVNSRTPYFLMVGSVEPRKNHALVLEAFEILWRSGNEAKLVIAYGNTWNSDDLIRIIKCHPLFNKNLFLLNNLTDKDLILLYGNCCATILGSFAEGFGLPIIEARQYGASVICNDIPVFREIGGENVSFFEFNNATSLVEKIVQSICANIKQQENIKKQEWITWAQSAKSLAIKTLYMTGKQIE